MRGLPTEFSAPAQRAFGLIIPAAPKLAAIFWDTLGMNKGLIQNGSAGSRSLPTLSQGSLRSQCDSRQPPSQQLRCEPATPLF